jgi:hypothetical protein
MSAFPKTRAAAEYAVRHSRAELTRTHAAVLLRWLTACQAAMDDGAGQPPVIAAGLMRSLVLAARDLAGPAWLDARGDDPDVAAFTVLEATASPPDAARIDEICSRVLWARFAPAAGRDYPGNGGTRSGRPAPGPTADGENKGPAASGKIARQR